MLLPLLAALALLKPGVAPASEPPLAIVGATVLDGTGGPPLPDAVVLIRDGHFTAVGPRTRVKIPPNARQVDGAGKWLIPGLIDMHVHLDEVLTPGAFVLYGVTSVRDVGSRLETIQALRTRAARGEGMPRLYWMGQNIDQGAPSWWGAVAVKGPEEVPALLDTMQQQGVDGVKLYVRAKPDVSRAVIAEAHRRHWPVTGHLDDTLPSVAAGFGIDNLEHVTTLFQELRGPLANAPEGYSKTFMGVAEVDLQGQVATRLLTALVRHHVAITPTLTVALLPAEGERSADITYGDWAAVPDGWRRYWHDPYWDFIGTRDWTPDDYARARAARAPFLKFVGMLDRAGVPIIAGTDTPAPWVLPGAGLLTELELLVEAGLTPNKALLAATGRAADILHKSADVGTIRKGRYADCILLDADPLQDIRNLHRIRAVYQGGKESDLPALQRAFQNADPKSIHLGP